MDSEGETEASDGEESVEEKTEPAEPTGPPICLTSEDIFAADDKEREWVACPEWAPKDAPEEDKGRYGGYAHGLSGTDRDAFESSILSAKGSSKGGKKKDRLDNVRAKLVQRSFRNETGDLIFDARQVTMVGMKSGKIVDRIFDVCQRLSGMTKEDVEDLEEN